MEVHLNLFLNPQEFYPTILDDPWEEIFQHHGIFLYPQKGSGRNAAEVGPQDDYPTLGGKAAQLYEKIQ
jgi:hypothetical protein